MRDIVRDPETGNPALVRVTYEVIEMEIFEKAYADAQGDFDSLLLEQLEINGRVDAAESRLAEAKSELELAQTVVADVSPGSDVDEGEDGTSSEDEVAVDEAAPAQVA